MPPISMWLVRLSLLYLMAGSTLGGLLLASKGLTFGTWLWQLRPLHTEFMLFGWMVQLTFGVASWILPRTRGGSQRTPLLQAAAMVLNLGLWMTGLGEVLCQPVWLLLPGRLAEALAAVLFALYIWPRVRSAVRR